MCHTIKKNPLIIVQLLHFLLESHLFEPTNPSYHFGFPASAAAMVAGKMPPKKQTRKPREEKRFATFHPKQHKIISNISLACLYNTPHHPEPFLVIPSSFNGFFLVSFFAEDCHRASRLRIAQKIFSGIMLMPSCRFWANFIMVQGDHKQQSTPPLC